ncbi:MAG: glutamate--tRNA ligase [Ignavibacteriales bacterium]|nr:glutamate--tRNA ligase [Ignavibacteriales bacterium]
MNNLNQIRVRFAPSPTGYLHVGGLRTALYNYLFARKNKGVFVLRIEDTDRARYVEGAVENLIDTLHWCGLDYDEGPNKEGEFGPYIQSERLKIYHEYAERLIQTGHAYNCFCTSARIEELREEQQKRNDQTKYDKHCLKLSKDDVQSKLKENIPHVVRLNVNSDKKVIVDDIIRGRVEFDSNLIDDQVLIKSDGYPTYHLANVVDDHLMKISHVIRGEEWLPSTPKHVLLYEAFGWELPLFAHLPLLLNPDKSKLSKRQGDVAVEDYRTKGYLRESLVNFVALLGWNPGTEQEIFSLEGLMNSFSLESVNKAGAVFNIEKLNAFNFEHLRLKSDKDVLAILKELLGKSKFANHNWSDDSLLLIIEAMRPRISFVKDIIENSHYFFEAPLTYDEEVLKKRWKEDSSQQLEILIEEFSKLNNPSKEQYEEALHTAANKLAIGNGKLIHGVRLAVSGVGGGPGLYDMLYILGKDETIRRIRTAIERLK